MPREGLRPRPQRQPAPSNAPNTDALAAGKEQDRNIQDTDTTDYELLRQLVGVIDGDDSARRELLRISEAAAAIMDHDTDSQPLLPKKSKKMAALNGPIKVKRRCKPCQLANQPSCDRLSRDSCTYCLNNGLDCSLEMGGIYSLDQAYQIQKKMAEVKGLIYPPQLKRNGPYARLASDAIVDSSLLDALHRSISHHFKVVQEQEDLDDSIFGLLDPSSLLALGILTEEIIRSLINHN